MIIAGKMSRDSDNNLLRYSREVVSRYRDSQIQEV